MLGNNWKNAQGGPSSLHMSGKYNTLRRHNSSGLISYFACEGIYEFTCNSFYQDFQ